MQLSKGKHNLCSVFACSFLCLKSLSIFALLFSFIISLCSTPQLSLQMWLESACLKLAVVAAKHTSYKFPRVSAWWGAGLVLVTGKERIEAKSCAVSTHCWHDSMRRFVKVGSGGSKEQKSPCSTASIPFICHGGILALPASLPLVKCPPPQRPSAWKSGSFAVF